MFYSSALELLYYNSHCFGKNENRALFHSFFTQIPHFIRQSPLVPETDYIISNYDIF